MFKVTHLRIVERHLAATWDDTLDTCVTCHPTEVNMPRLNHVGRYSIYLLREMKG